MRSNFRSFSVLALVAAMTGASVARAGDEAQARALLAQAEAKYAQRGANLAPTNEAAALLKQAEGLAEQTNTKYDIKILLSRCLYWKGMHVDGKDAKMAAFEESYTKAEQAKTVADFAEAYYYYAISLGRWAEAKGVLASLGRKDELIRNVNGALDRDTRTGDLGETLDGHGPDRTLGRMYFKLPGFAGGSHTSAIRHLKNATDAAPGHSLNHVYYAETLYDGNAQEKAQGCRMIRELLTKNPDEMGRELNRVAETREEFEQARKLLSEMTCN
jgi:hypothetical protein